MNKEEARFDNRASFLLRSEFYDAIWRNYKMNSITNEIAGKVFEELESIAKIKKGGLRLHSISGGHITFIAKNDDEAFLKGAEMQTVIKRAYGLYQRPSALITYSVNTWWNLEKCTNNGFNNEYELTVGLN